MSTVSAEQLTEIVEHIGNQLHLPQVVQKFDKGLVFSTSEQMVGQWLDKKPLYQKTYSFVIGTVTDGTPLDSVVDVSDLNYDMGYVYDGFMIWANATNNRLSLNDTWTVGSTRYTNRAQLFNNEIHMTTDMAGSTGATCYITLRYTKTTDTALDYTIGTENDYSTEERLIGAWVDGSGVYQKTVYLGALPNNTSKDVAHNISDSFRLISAFGAAYRSSDGANIPLPMVDMSLANMVRINITQSKITVVTGSDRSTWTGYVTIQYIKTA